MRKAVEWRGPVRSSQEGTPLESIEEAGGAGGRRYCRARTIHVGARTLLRTCRRGNQWTSGRGQRAIDSSATRGGDTRPRESTVSTGLMDHNGCQQANVCTDEKSSHAALLTHGPFSIVHTKRHPDHIKTPDSQIGYYRQRSARREKHTNAQTPYHIHQHHAHFLKKEKWKTRASQNPRCASVGTPSSLQPPTLATLWAGLAISYSYSRGEKIRALQSCSVVGSSGSNEVSSTPGNPECERVVVEWALL